MVTSSERFLKDFHYLATIGATPQGGVHREAGSTADAMQRAWFGGKLAAEGFEVQFDEVGNQFGLLEFDPKLPYILVGSHLDSQPTAGAYDGAYGVIAAAQAAFEVANRVRASDTSPQFNLGVVNWFNEEGSRFTPSMMGSAVFTGKLSADAALDSRDRSGISVRECLGQLGQLGSRPQIEVAGYLEIHIEQGRLMEREGAQVGIVTATWGARKFEITIHGEQAHTGSAEMADRRDALLGAAELILLAKNLSREHVASQLHTAVSTIDVYPNSPVVVASRAKINLDLRCEDASVLDGAAGQVAEAVSRIEAEHGLEIDVQVTHSWDVNPYDEGLFETAQQAIDEGGFRGMQLKTIAGHDSTNMKDIAPTIMLFIPSVDGISHNIREFSKDDDLVAGLQVLTDCLNRMCSVPA